ncbi:DUF294 nucleotidyltransferase-like domain-containing protein [Vibrio sp. 10N.261.51.F12]|uniref:DUF294 nucleotidyltransferase-like domain-containing protein n=1 Tax=Vibrio sp. 10N.261.51.F12 TaxID=3229679 RepID=UPI003551B8BC
MVDTMDESLSTVGSNSLYECIEQIASSAYVVLAPDATIVQTARAMRDNDSCEWAVIFEHDQLRGVISAANLSHRALAEALPLDSRIDSIMDLNPLTTSSKTRVYDAIVTMYRYQAQSMVVMSETRMISLLTLPALLQNNRLKMVYLVEKIHVAQSEQDIADLTVERRELFLDLVNGKVPAEMVYSVMTLIMDTINCRLIDFAIQRLGKPPCDFCWVVAGSQARKEVHAYSDQDSGILLENSATKQDEAYFTHMAMIVSKGLDKCGYELCAGKFMGSNPKWCQRLQVWEQYFQQWIANPELENLLNLSVFLDTRAIYGDHHMLGNLNAQYTDVKSNALFLRKMINDAVTNRAPLNIFNNLVLVKDSENIKRLNLKRHGINVIVDLARLYAMRSKSMECNTNKRLNVAYSCGEINLQTHLAISRAYEFLSEFRLLVQAKEVEKGMQPSALIDPNYLGEFDKARIVDAFKLISDWQKNSQQLF